MDFFSKIGKGLEEVGDDVKGVFGHGHHESNEEERPEEHPSDQPGAASQQAPRPQANPSNRYQSFAPPSSGGAKWYVDGASYFWAVSVALERESPSAPRDITGQVLTNSRGEREHLHSRLVVEPGAVPPSTSCPQ